MMKVPDLDSSTVAILAAAGVAALLLWKLSDKAGEAVGGAVDMAGGLLTGNNPITEGARTDAYQNAGVLGTMGAATDRISGGVLSQFGEWLGGKAYEITH